jgi:23S rRNA (uracil1939-C5)-methyltransferase
MNQNDKTNPSHVLNSSIEFKASVRALSHKGHGVIDHSDGRVFFAKGVWIGDVGVFRVEEKAQNYQFAELIELTVAASERVEVPCPHRGDQQHTCGGCPWMLVSYTAQIKAKEQRISFLLDKNGILPILRTPLIAAPSEWGYRNRAQFKTDGKRLGYVSEGTNDLAPIEDCLILNAPMRGILKDLRAQLPNSNWKPTPNHTWSYLEVDDLQKVKEVVPNRRRPFRQGNSEQNEAMKSWIIASLQSRHREDPIVEAFCGSGNFTESLSRSGFSNIVAAEVRGIAIQELKAKELPGVRIMEIDMNDKDVWQQLARQQSQAKILLVDPPREGIEKRKGMFTYLKKLELIIYISCEPATWARDVKDFQLNGWKVAQVTPLDMFPHTPHVEILSILVKA